jgi:hypothetical protein
MYSIANGFFAKYRCMDFMQKKDNEVKLNRMKSELVTVRTQGTRVTVTNCSVNP